MRETASVRRQAPRNVASSLDAARELGIRDAQGTDDGHACAIEQVGPHDDSRA